MVENELALKIVLIIIVSIIVYKITKHLYGMISPRNEQQLSRGYDTIEEPYYPPIAKIGVPEECEDDDFRCNQQQQQQQQQQCAEYGYGIKNGPHFWSQRICMGNKQSPINIMSCNATIHMDRRCLNWSREYSIVPESMYLENDGICVNLYGKWAQGCGPYFFGGPLSEPFELKMIKFRWGPNSREGSEHMLQSKRFAMEVQAIHYKKGLDDLCQALNYEKVVIVSFLYQDSRLENLTFAPIIYSLPKITCPNSSCRLTPFPISLIIPPFLNNFYMYNGSLTFPPCTENVKWIIQPEPLIIHDRQVAEFRKLNSFTGKILTNVRQIQKLNCRDIYYYQ